MSVQAYVLVQTTADTPASIRDRVAAVDAASAARDISATPIYRPIERI